MTFTTVISFSLKYIMCVTIYYFLQYIIDTVMPFRLRLPRISLFIRVASSFAGVSKPGYFPILHVAMDNLRVARQNVEWDFGLGSV